MTLNLDEVLMKQGLEKILEKQMKIEERMDSWKKMNNWEKEEKLEKFFVEIKLGVSASSSQNRRKCLEISRDKFKKIFINFL